jgi:GNAT superfamily N-acetyltransferase
VGLSRDELRALAASLTFDVVDPRSPSAVAAVGRYFAEIGQRFGYVADGQSEKDAVLLVPPAGVFVLALSDGAPAACGGVQTIGDGVGEIKRMWVSDDWRGAGLGSRLLRHLEDQSRGLGHRVVRLDTNASLTEAIAMYERFGYERIERYNDNPFATNFYEKRL